jgi:hypothetical protein
MEDATAPDAIPEQEITLQKALPQWASLVADNPTRVDVWANLVLGHAVLNEPRRALAICREALFHHPTSVDLLRHEANLCHRLHDWAASAAAFHKILVLVPNDAKAWVNLGLTQKKAGNFDEAEGCYRRASLLGDAALAAQAQFNLANLLLAQKKWRDGFAAYEGRLRKPGAPVCPWVLPPWHEGLPSGSRILLWNDQGLGDAIMFMRFAQTLAARQHRIFLFGQKTLKAFAHLAPFIEDSFDPLDDPQEMDACLPLCSLPHALDVTSLSEWSAPYLHPQKTSIFAFPERTPRSPLRVGLVWGGNRAHVNDASRSMPLEQLTPLFDLPGISWYSLQLGRGEERLPFAARLHDLSPFLIDFSATASLLPHLDLLISVDTAPAHLAGAAGMPVWILLAKNNGDWRWPAHSEHSAWYPSARLYRQTTEGDWTAVIQGVRRQLLLLSHQSK